MNNAHLWSLRLGFSRRQADDIEKNGIKAFLQKSFDETPNLSAPDFMREWPKTAEEYKVYRVKIKKDPVLLEQFKKNGSKPAIDLEKWWLEKIYTAEMPLREKMVVFWHNHFVTSSNKVKVYYWLFEHNSVLRQHAFGNFRELTKMALKTNAMIQYLDNDLNREGRINENLSRELLELFTIGVGNYTEQDIKNGAKGLAGLTYSKGKAEYKERIESNEIFNYFNEKGSFKADEMVDIIFRQKNAPYLITRKLLKWFIYDNPPEDLVVYYGDYLRKVDYGIKDFLVKMFTEEYDKPTAGSKIKNPLEFIMQILHELNFEHINYDRIYNFTRVQNMELYKQLNVKGWDGGRLWLTAQLFSHRNDVADQVCKGRLLGQPVQMSEDLKGSSKIVIPTTWKKNTGNDAVKFLTNNLLFAVDDQLKKEIQNIVPEEFNPSGRDGDYTLLTLYNFLIKTPEFQLI